MAERKERASAFRDSMFWGAPSMWALLVCARLRVAMTAELWGCGEGGERGPLSAGVGFLASALSTFALRPSPPTGVQRTSRASDSAETHNATETRKSTRSRARALREPKPSTRTAEKAPSLLPRAPAFPHNGLNNDREGELLWFAPSSSRGQPRSLGAAREEQAVPSLPPSRVASRARAQRGRGARLREEERGEGVALSLLSLPQKQSRRRNREAAWRAPSRARR
jgi:hypothetical protein